MLVKGSYSTMNEKMKAATLQNWMTDRGQKIFRTNSYSQKRETTRRNTTSLTMIHSWYNLGALHSHHCKDQLDFMSKLPNLSKECGFTNQDEVVKFLFLIHNSQRHVQDQLLKEITQASTINNLHDESRQSSNLKSLPRRHIPTQVIV